MQNDYAMGYRDLYQNHWWWRARERAILEELARLRIRPDGTRRILDIGCGDGLLFDCLAPFGDVWGVEADPATLSEHGKWRQRIFQRPFDGTFLPDEKFDLILMLDFLEHLPDPESALRHAKTLLRPDGRMLMTVPALNALWTTHDVLNHHYVRYDRRSFSELAAHSGVVLDRLRYFFHWTCPVKLLIRLRESVAGTAARPPAVPPRLVNQFCYALSCMEQKMLSWLDLPFGSSLMAVGTPKPGT